MEYGLSSVWDSDMTMDSESLLDSEKVFNSEENAVELFSYLFQNLPLPSLLFIEKATAKIVSTLEVTACKPTKIQM